MLSGLVSFQLSAMRSVLYSYDLEPQLSRKPVLLFITSNSLVAQPTPSERSKAYTNTAFDTEQTWKVEALELYREISLKLSFGRPF